VETPELTLTITFNSALGNYFARLSNGASFVIERQDIGGKLENNLKAFARGCVLAGKVASGETKRELRSRLPKDEPTQVFTANPVPGHKPRYSLEDLDI
jgi:hypothetical protein